MSSFADLAQPNELTLRFVGGGFSTASMLRPDDAVDYQRSLVADATATAGVPASIQRILDRLKDKHIRGVLDYTNYAEVCNDAIGAYEPALKARFLQFYADRDIPFTDRNGTPAPLRTSEYDEVYAHVSATEGMHIEGATGHSWFNGTLDGLLKWARLERLLTGQAARGRERYMLKLRNSIAHGSGFVVETPVSSVGAIHDLAEFINALWGAPTPGGRCYPAPAARDVLAIGWRDNGGSELAYADTLSASEDPSMQWILMLGEFEDPHAFGFDSRYLLTRLPRTYLWGPGPVAEAVAWMEKEQPKGDVIDVVDRLMLVRQHRGRLYLPQEPETAAAAHPSEQAGKWSLMLADHPQAAFNCVRGRLIQDPGHLGGCACSTERLAKGTWQKMRHRLTDLVPDLQPLLVPDVRVEDFRLPRRWTEIASGE